jgi:hypothetical protein
MNDDFPDEAESDPVMAIRPSVDLHLGVPVVKQFQGEWVETNLFKSHPYLMMTDAFIVLMTIGFIWLLVSVWQWIIFT